MRVLFILGAIGYMVVSYNLNDMADGKDGLWTDVAYQAGALVCLAAAAFCTVMAHKVRK